MQEQISEPLAQPLASSSPPVKLWTPGLIAAVTFLAGFPAGIVLASINWMRMKLSNKAIIHLSAGAAGTFVVVLLLLFLPGSAGRFLGLGINLGILFYLRQQMNRDLELFKTSNSVEKANELGGCLLGLGVLILFLGAVFALVFVLVMLGVPIPE